MNIFGDICSTIRISIPAIKSMFRLQNENNKIKKNSPDVPIIVKMWSPYDKNFFLKSLAGFKKMNKDFYFTLNDVGLGSNTKLCINESLIQSNYQILREAKRMKRDGIFQCFYNARIGLCQEKC